MREFLVGGRGITVRDSMTEANQRIEGYLPIHSYSFEYDVVEPGKKDQLPGEKYVPR